MNGILVVVSAAPILSGGRQLSIAMEGTVHDIVIADILIVFSQLMIVAICGHRRRYSRG